MHRRLRFRFGFDPLEIDDRTADRILSGDPTDEAPAYAVVAQLMNSAVNATREVGNETAAINTIMSSVQGSNHLSRRKVMFGHAISTKVAVIAAGIVLSTGSVAAAATGSLPDSAQDKVSKAAKTVGVDVPKSKDAKKKDAAKKNASTATHPGKEACEKARAVEDAKGCSAVAKAWAETRGNGEKNGLTGDKSADKSTDKADDKGKSEDAKDKAEDKSGDHGKSREHTPTTVKAS